MPETLISTDDIIVLGPPEVVELLVDVGPQGIRGNKIYSGQGNPNTLSGFIPSGETVQLNDMFVDYTSSGGAYLYQYLNDPVLGNTWKGIVKVSPVLFAKNYSATFTTGSFTQNIPLSTILPDYSSTQIQAITSADIFNIQFNILGSDPIASSVAKSIVTISDVKNLQLVFKAVSVTTSATTNLTGAQTVQVFISVVTP